MRQKDLVYMHVSVGLELTLPLQIPVRVRMEGEGEEGMAVLKKKMKELSAAHDVVVKNRSVQCAVSDQPLMSCNCCIYQSLHVYDKHTY